MTRDEYRAACFWAMEAAYDAAGARKPGTHHRSLLAAFDALHGIARVNPIEATDEMVNAAGLTPYPELRADEWRAMSAKGDLTNPPELNK